MTLDELQQLISSDFLFKSITSLILIITMVIVRKLALNKLHKKGQKKGKDYRHSINIVKQLSHGVMFASLILVWSSEVQNLAISVAAFMVAIVLAIREFLQCLLGFLYYIFTRPFRIGDWIQIQDASTGEVYSIDWIKVTLLEVDPDALVYTGKTVYVPNNQLISRTLRNLNFMRRYNMHSFTLTFEPRQHVLNQLAEIKRFARELCLPFRDVALRYKDLIERHLENEFIEIDPAVNIETNEFGYIELTISLFCPTDRAPGLQQQITEHVLYYTLPQENEAHQWDANRRDIRPEMLR